MYRSLLKSDHTSFNSDRTTFMTDGLNSVTQIDSSTRMFSKSMVISGIRCMLSYVVFPWLLPVLGVTGTVGPLIGIPIALVAIWFNISSIKRFTKSGHQLKKLIIPINTAVIALLLVLVVFDVLELIN